MIKRWYWAVDFRGLSDTDGVREYIWKVGEVFDNGQFLLQETSITIPKPFEEMNSHYSWDDFEVILIPPEILNSEHLEVWCNTVMALNNN